MKYGITKGRVVSYAAQIAEGMMFLHSQVGGKTYRCEGSREIFTFQWDDNIWGFYQIMNLKAWESYGKILFLPKYNITWGFDQIMNLQAC